MNIVSGTSFLLMLFCFTKPYDCLADTCFVRNIFPQTVPKLDIGDYAKSTIRSVIFEQQSVERESRMVNVRERVGTERLVNNRRIVDSDSRISNYPAKSANNKPANSDRTEKIINRDFRRSTFTDRIIANRHRVVNEFRIRDSNERDIINNRKYLTHESQPRMLTTTRQQNFSKETTTEGVRIALTFNNQRTMRPVSRESDVDRESRIVDVRERTKYRDLTTVRDATRIISKFNNFADVIRDSRELPNQTGSAERRQTIDRTISSTRSIRAHNLKSLKNDVRKTVDRISHSINFYNRFRTQRMKTASNNSLRESANERRIMYVNSQIPVQERRATTIRVSRLLNSHQPKTRNFQSLSTDRMIENRETRDQRSISNSQIAKLERRDSRYSADNRIMAGQTHPFDERFGSSRAAGDISNNREKPSDIEKVRKLETRSLSDDVKFNKRDSRVRERIINKLNTRTFEEKMNSGECVSAVRKLEERSSRRYRSDAFSGRDLLIRELPTRSNIRSLKENSSNRGKTHEDQTRRINDVSRKAERRTPVANRKSTDAAFNLRTARHLRMSNDYRIDDRRANERNLQNVDTRIGRISTDYIRYSVSTNNYLSTKDENNNERLEVNERHSNPNNNYAMMTKRTISYTTWSNIVTTALSVLLFAHMLGTSSDLKKYQYLPSYFNAVKEKVF